MKSKEPFRRRIGHDFQNRDGETVTPFAFIHPCWVPECTSEGSFGFGVSMRLGRPGRWYCLDHKDQGNLWLTSTAHNASQPTGGRDASGTGDSDLFSSGD